MFRVPARRILVHLEMKERTVNLMRCQVYMTRNPNIIDGFRAVIRDLIGNDGANQVRFGDRLDCRRRLARLLSWSRQVRLM